MIKMEAFQAVALLSRLRDGTSKTVQRQRRIVFSGITDALKGLGLVQAKTKILGVYEGLDQSGNHWFMVEEESQQASTYTIEEALLLHSLRVLIGGEDWRPEKTFTILQKAVETITALRATRDEMTRKVYPDTTGQ